MIIKTIAELWKSGRESRHISRIDLVEGFYLMSILQTIDMNLIVEIGTKHAGTTYLFWAMSRRNLTCILSIDDGSEGHEILVDNEDFKREVEFAREKSETYPNSEMVNSIDLMFVDGGHEYIQVKRDWLWWNHCIKVGGSIIFHDARNSPERPGVEKLMNELRISSRFKDHWYEEKDAPASLVHFRRVK